MSRPSEVRFGDLVPFEETEMWVARVMYQHLIPEQAHWFRLSLPLGDLEAGSVVQVTFEDGYPTGCQPVTFA